MIFLSKLVTLKQFTSELKRLFVPLVMKLQECSSSYAEDVTIGGDVVTRDENTMVERRVKTCFYISTVLKKLDLDRGRYFIDFIKAALYNSYHPEVDHCWAIYDYIAQMPTDDYVPKMITHYQARFQQDSASCTFEPNLTDADKEALLKRYKDYKLSCLNSSLQPAQTNDNYLIHKILPPSNFPCLTKSVIFQTGTKKKELPEGVRFDLFSRKIMWTHFKLMPGTTQKF